MSKKEKEEIINKLKCTRCGVVKEQYSSIVYSQGERVCVGCKKETQASDNAAFDRFQASRGVY